MTEAPLPYLEGKGEGRLSFEDIDQHYHLKINALIELGMPSIFKALERRFDLSTMRTEGIVPIMFYLEFETYPQPVLFGSRVETDFRVRLRRSVIPGPPKASAGKVERLLLDMGVNVQARESSGDPQSLGGGPRDGNLVSAGQMRATHVITRPVAPPGERQVLEVPPALRGLQEHPWEGPYPSVEGLEALPAGYRECEAGPWHEQRAVWGLHNTDINQHVNVHEYIKGMEDHFSRMLFGGNLPVARHRIGRMQILFRKPFFMGDACGVRGRLYTDDHRTLLLAGIHHVEPEGGLEPRPAVFARLEGEIRPSG